MVNMDLKGLSRSVLTVSAQLRSSWVTGTPPVP